jgi:hypothetical protein
MRTLYHFPVDFMTKPVLSIPRTNVVLQLGIGEY